MSRPLKLLLVEDSEDDALLIRRELRRNGFDVDEKRVDTEHEMVAALKEETRDIIISDYSMPGFNGMRALEIAQESGLDLPFIVVSGNIGEETAVSAMLAGAHDYVMKDNLARLAPAVNRELDEAAERAARRRADEAYRNLVESSLQGLVILQDYRVVFANQAAAEVLCTTVEELTSLSANEIYTMVHPLNRDGEWQRYRDIMAGLDVPPRFELRVIRRDGAFRTVEMIASRIEFEGRFAVQAALVDITERVRHRRVQEAMVTAATALRAAESSGEIAPQILEQVMDLLDCEAALLATREEAQKGGPPIEDGSGLWQITERRQRQSLKTLCRHVYSTGVPLLSNADSDGGRQSDELMDDSMPRAVAAVPLLAEDNVIGALVIGRSVDITDDDLRVLTAVAEMTASALRRVWVLEELQHSHLELAQAYDSTLEGWARALELRDQDTVGHTRRVADMTLRLAAALGWQGQSLVHLRRGAVLHDIGKLAIPDRILLKPGPLTDEEWAMMKMHPIFAHEMLAPIEHLRNAIDIPIYHHEWWDGSGYPHGLAGDQIPAAARIFAVVDVWDALRSDRTYRKAWSFERVTTYIRELAGRQFELRVVDAFLKLVAREVELVATEV